MDRFPPSRADTRTLVRRHDALDLRATVAAAPGAAPVDEQALRDCVWTYVRGERRVGVAPATVIRALADVVESAKIAPAEASSARTRDVKPWCVEAYVGRLGGEALGGHRETAVGAAAQSTAGGDPAVRGGT